MKELAVLRPRPEDIPDDDWPGYVLNDATIYRKDGKTLANPLLLSLEGNLVVRGQLEIDDPDLLPNRKSSLSLLLTHRPVAAVLTHRLVFSQCSDRV